MSPMKPGVQIRQIGQAVLALGIALAIYVLLISGCKTSTKLPLCQKLAELSYDTIDAGRGKVVNRFVAEECLKRHIDIRPLSYCVAEFSGRASQIKWLRNSYPDLLSGFNPKLVIQPEPLYTSSEEHVRQWMALVDAGKTGDLMLKEYVYCPDCCSTDTGTPALKSPATSPH
jgi:hypothetical protein